MVNQNLIPVFFITHRVALTNLLEQEGLKNGLKISFICRNSLYAVECFKRHPEKIVVMDGYWVGSHEAGIELMQKLISLKPDVRVIGYSGYHQTPIPKIWRDNGGWGYFTTSKSIIQIARVVKRVHAGEQVFDIDEPVVSENP